MSSPRPMRGRKALPVLGPRRGDPGGRGRLALDRLARWPSPISSIADFFQMPERNFAAFGEDSAAAKKWLSAEGNSERPEEPLPDTVPWHRLS